MGQYVPPQVYDTTPQQEQYQTQAAALGLYNGNSSYTESESEANVIQSPSSSNIQINNNGSSEFSYGVGYRRPVPNFTGGMFIDQRGDIGGQMTFTTYFGGGKSRKHSDRILNARAEAVEIANATNFMSLCNSIHAQNLDINYSGLSDKTITRCNGLIAKRTMHQEPKTKEVTDLSQLSNQELINKMMATIEKLEYSNRKLRKQLEEVYAQDEVNPFDPDGE